MPATKAERRHYQFRDCFVALLSNSELYSRSGGEGQFLIDCERLATDAAMTLEDDFQDRIGEDGNGDEIDPAAPVLQEGAG